ncbi:MAG: radical SAM protein [Desulfobacteraceae bacterium]
MASHISCYIKSYRDGTLQARAEDALEKLSECTLCPRHCRIDRTRDQHGYCSTGRWAEVASYDAHFGEESPLVGRHGSGTIFFSHCNLLCNFCQNYDISHRGFGREMTDEQLADIMLSLQSSGCHNINFVTPSHVVPQILSALVLAASQGLTVPLVYNSSGYDSVETLRLLDGIIDIYMPDFKFWDAKIADQTCQAPDYPKVARDAVTEMHHQVGDLVLDPSGLAVRGVLIRHLVLPDGLAGTSEVMDFIANRISANTYVNVMAQFRPCGRAAEVKALGRSISDTEYQDALKAAADAGIQRLDRPGRRFVLF